ncbi:MAG: hypothetical protein ABL888_11550 [Pirellulaceae bacterium]
MKKTILATVLLLAFSVFPRLGIAQELSYSLPQLTQLLDMTAAQEAQWSAYHQRIIESPNEIAFLSKEEAIARQQKFLESILTPEQIEVEKFYRRIKKDILHALNSNTSPLIEVLLGAEISGEFDLTDAQKIRLGDLQKSFEGELKSIKNDLDSSFEELRRQLDREGIELLTDSQKAKLKLLFGKDFDFSESRFVSVVKATRSFSRSRFGRMSPSDHSILIFLWPGAKLDIRMTDEIVGELVKSEEVQREIGLSPEQKNELEKRLPLWSEVVRKYENLDIDSGRESNYENFLSEKERETGKSAHAEVLSSNQIERLQQIFRQLLVRIYRDGWKFQHPAVWIILECTAEQTRKLKALAADLRSGVEEQTKEIQNRISEAHSNNFVDVYQILDQQQQEKYDKTLQAIFPIPNDDEKKKK